MKKKRTSLNTLLRLKCRQVQDKGKGNIYTPEKKSSLSFRQEGKRNLSKRNGGMKHSQLLLLQGKKKMKSMKKDCSNNTHLYYSFTLEEMMTRTGQEGVAPFFLISQKKGLWLRQEKQPGERGGGGEEAKKKKGQATVYLEKKIRVQRKKVRTEKKPSPRKLIHLSGVEKKSREERKRRKKVVSFNFFRERRPLLRRWGEDNQGKKERSRSISP